MAAPQTEVSTRKHVEFSDGSEGEHVGVGECAGVGMGAVGFGFGVSVGVYV